MKNSTNNNIIARYRWLEAIKSGSISVTKKQAQAISSMREFCKLEVPDYFTKIAYNTLKSKTTTGKIIELNAPGISLWEYIKTLRQEAADTIPKSETPSPKYNNPDLPELYAAALLEAHLCSLAYLEIYRFLDDLASSPHEKNLDISELISNQLKICSAKFKAIVSPGRMTSESRSFELIIGGKAP